MAKKKFKIPKSAFMNILLLFARATPFFPDTYILSLIIKDLKKARSSMDEKIFIAHKSLQETSELIKELEKNLKERTEKLDKLKVDFEKYSKLAVLEEEKLKPLIKQLESSLRKGRNVERWFGLVLSIIGGLIVFILGIIFGPALKGLLGLA